MNITIIEFLATLNAHRVLSNALPSFNLEEHYWKQWKFDDEGAHYIPPMERTSLIIDRAEERFYETGKWPMQ